jgi:hypothetical protein
MLLAAALRLRGHFLRRRRYPPVVAEEGAKRHREKIGAGVKGGIAASAAFSPRCAVVKLCVGVGVCAERAERRRVCGHDQEQRDDAEDRENGGGGGGWVYNGHWSVGGDGTLHQREEERQSTKIQTQNEKKF